MNSSTILCVHTVLVLNSSTIDHVLVLARNSTVGIQLFILTSVQPGGRVVGRGARYSRVPGSA
jgi:hypothetical protein